MNRKNRFIAIIVAVIMVVSTYSPLILADYNPIFGFYDLKQAGFKISGVKQQYDYNDGLEIKPQVTVSNGSTTLVKGTDYVVRYENNSAAGSTATIIVTGQGHYGGELKAYFYISKPGGGGSTTQPTPEIFVSQRPNGTVSISNYSSFNDKVTITAIPDEGYKINKVYKNGEELHPSNGQYYFFWNGQDTYVYATFISNKPVIKNGSCGEHLTWSLDDDGNLTISGYGDMYDWSDQDAVPWNDFKNTIISVSFADTVTSIGSNSFVGYSGITSVVFPQNLLSIGDNAFQNCDSIASVYFSDSVCSIGNNAFDGCQGLADVYYENTAGNWSNISIGSNNAKLVKASFHFENSNDGVYLGACGDNLTWTINEEGTLTILGSGDMFDWSSSSDVPWYYKRNSIKEILLDDNVTSIGNYAFANLYYIEGVELPGSLERLGDYAFGSCSNLKKIDIPNTVSSVGDCAFYYCYNMTSCTISDGVNSIGANAFMGCRNITTISVPDSITSIGKEAFYGCSSINSINIPDGLKKIEKNTFLGCSGLTSVEIPSGISSIGESAFKNCSISSVNIPKSINTVGDNAFAGCGLTDVYYEGTKSDWYKISKGAGFNGSNFKVHLENSSLGINLGTCGNNLTWETDGEETLTIFGSGAMYTYNYNSSCPWYGIKSNIKYIILTDGITTISSNAFLGFNLKSITIPSSVNSVGDYAFYDSTLKNVYYDGTDVDWASINIGSNNEQLLNATRKYAYALTLNNVVNGTVSLSATKANAGDTIIVTVSPYYGYELDTISVNGVAIVGTSFVMPENDVTVEVLLKKIQYNITFDSNGYGVAPEAQVVDYGKCVIRPSTPTETGYTFGGWYTDSACTEPFNFYNSVYSDVTLFAKWTINTYPVYFYPNNGNNMVEQLVAYGSTVNKPEDPSLTGYTFDGWYSDSICTQLYDFATPMPLHYIELYAKWSINTYTVSFNNNGHGTSTVPNQELCYGDYANYYYLYDPDYTFGGWYTDSACTKEYDFTTPVDANITLYAKWTAISVPQPVPAPEPVSVTEPDPVSEPNQDYPTPYLTSGVAHVQDIGDVTYTVDSIGVLTIGTTGMGKRMEQITINFVNCTPYSGTLEYRVHVQDIGWMDWTVAGQKCGTEGMSKRIEAIEIRLTGELAEYYSVQYSVHIQDYGDMQGWVKDGALAGTTGESKRIEELRIKIVPIGSDSSMSVKYRVHVQDYGWEKSYSSNGQMSGTSGEAKRLEGIEIFLDGTQYSGGIKYKTHVQNIGWESGYAKDGEMSGTQGLSYRLEGICIELYGEVAEYYDVYYRVHAQDIGWMGWAKNGECAGTAGRSARLEGIQIVLVPKGSPAPSATCEGITAVTDQAFVEGF